MNAVTPQHQAANPALSVWVGASAGTGKTTVLTSRMLRLLLSGVKPSRLLCLTFTKAGAAEMANRLIERLRRWAFLDESQLYRELLDLLAPEEPDDATLTRARRLFATVLDAPGGLKIQTIHAFCQSLLARFPLEAGIAPNFEPLDEAVADRLFREAQARVIGLGRSGLNPSLDDALGKLSLRLQEDSFSDLLKALNAERGRLRRLADRHDGIEGLIAVNAQKLGLAPNDTVASVIAQAVRVVPEWDARLQVAAAGLEQSGKYGQTCAAAIRAFLAPGSDRAAGFRDYCAGFLTQEGEGRKNLVTKAVQQSNPALFDLVNDEIDRLMEIQGRLRSVELQEATSALLRVADAMITAYADLKRRRNALDYDDLILEARDLLQQEQGCSWVLYKLDGGLDHILIDEAQDTNPEQWQVIQALAEDFFAGDGAASRPRTIFVVGDRKQSIFSFQRADPAAFAQMRAHFKGRVQRASDDSWREVPLAVSYRSTAPVLALVDAVFSQPDAGDGVVEDGVIEHGVSRSGFAGLVEIWPPAEPPDLPDPGRWQTPRSRLRLTTAKVRTAQLVAAHIAALCGSGEILEARGRPIRPGDFLILVRQRSAFVPELVRALKARGVPIAGVDRMVLTEQLAVMDLLALARFLLLPDDDLSLACVLKSPLIGLSEEALYDLAQPRKGRLWPALIAKAEAGDAALHRARDLLGDLLARADYTPPFELFSHVLSACGGRRLLAARLGPEANDPLDEFLNQCLAYERTDPPSLQGFVHWIERGGLEVKRDANGAAGGGEVRVMTVHGAKGLEAPIVILADTMQMPQRLPPLSWPTDGKGNEAEWGPLWIPNKAAADATAKTLRAAAQAAQMQEYRRLLYVALTRAADRLYVVGWRDRKAPPAQPWYDLIAGGIAALGSAEAVEFDFSSLGFTEWAGSGWRLSSPQTVPPKDRDSPERVAALDAPLPIWLRRPPPAEPTPSRPLTPSRPEVEPPVQSPLGADDGRRFQRGRLIHRLLQTLPELPASDRPVAARRFLGRPHHDLAPDAVEALIGEAIGVLDDARFAAAFGPGSRAEVPLVGTLGSYVVAGQIDRLVVTPSRVLVVDYKTNRPPPQAVDGVAPAYLAQLAAYRALLRELYPDRPIDCALLWTDDPSWMAIPSELLDRHTPG